MSGKPSPSLWLTGGRKSPPPRIVLRAGNILVELDTTSGALRYFSVGGDEILRGIYAAVRDRNWRTVETSLCNLKLDREKDSFRVEFDALCRDPGIDLRWHGAIEGSSTSCLSYHFHGRAFSSFLRNRIGFCVLHPLQGVVGSECRLLNVDGSTQTGRFPDLISPHQPFRNLRSITHTLHGVRTTVTMQGDAFETEDQRNWTDASFKTYCTPLTLPFPIRVNAGDEVRQSITVQVTVPPSYPRQASSPKPPAVMDLRVPHAPSIALPELGLCASSDGIPLTDLECTRLRAAGVHHLRVDLELTLPEWRSRLDQVAVEAQRAGAALEVALHVSPDGAAELRGVADALRRLGVPVARLLLNQTGSPVTPPHWVPLAREWLRAEVGVGTDADFAELNRNRPVEKGDFLFYSVNPQVHAFDEDSLVETLEALPDTVRTARSFAGGRTIAVGPVTLKPRFNPNATGPEPPLTPGMLPPAVDHRQGTLFAGAWTLGAASVLSGSGCRSITWFETAGRRGIMARTAGCRQIDSFFAVPGAVYPIYHVLADLGSFSAGQALPAISSKPSQFRGLYLRSAGIACLLVANLSSRRIGLRLKGLPDGPGRIRRLNLATVEAAVTDPMGFRDPRNTQIAVGLPELDLEAYETVRLDWQQ